MSKRDYYEVLGVVRTAIDSDLKSAFVWARESLLLPLAKGSVIIFMSSGAATSGSSPLIAGYASAKAAIRRFAACIAVEGEPFGMRVHHLSPHLSAETQLGREAVKAFARAAGKSESELMAERGMVTPSMVGEGALEIITGSARTGTGFELDANGLRRV